MSRSKYKIYDNSYAHFITTGINYGLPVFSNPKAANIILENLLFLKQKKDVKLIAYVIMENHLHTILWGDELEDKFGKFKSYSARKIIDLFKQDGHNLWLKRMKYLKQNFKRDRDYQLWEESFHPKQILMIR